MFQTCMTAMIIRHVQPPTAPWASTTSHTSTCRSICNVMPGVTALNVRVHLALSSRPPSPGAFTRNKARRTLHDATATQRNRTSQCRVSLGTSSTLEPGPKQKGAPTDRSSIDLISRLPLVSLRLLLVGHRPLFSTSML